MLRTALAAVAAVLAIGLIGAPAAQADTCYGTGTTCSTDPAYKPGPEARRDAVHRIADPIAKRITDAIKRALHPPAAQKPQPAKKAPAPKAQPAKPKPKPRTTN